MGGGGGGGGNGKRAKPSFEFRKKKWMALKLFEFVEQFMIDVFFDKVNPI